MAKFITNFTKYNINPEGIVIYSQDYITKDFKYKEADIVYKLKEAEIYFLIEHQTKVDYAMSYRILNYAIEIIRSVVCEQKINKITFKYPKVVPIVLYTGKGKWKANTEFERCQIHKKEYENEVISIKYTLIDINKYETENLLKNKTLLSNMMILEQCKDNTEVLYYLKKIIKNTKTKDIRNLKRIVMYLYAEIDENVRNEISKIIEESESEKNMSTIRERIGIEFRNERKKAIAEGRAIGILKTRQQIIQSMIKMDFDDETIKQVTKAEKEEIEKIRKNVRKSIDKRKK